MMTLLALLIACALPEEGDGSGARSGTDCDTAGIEQRADRNGFSLVFSACGANTFTDFAWSTDGHKLYYQLGMTQKVLLADTKDRRSVVVPTPTAIGPAAWLSADEVVMPVGPDQSGGPVRLATFDLASQAVRYVDLPRDLKEPQHLTRSRDPSRLYLTAVVGEGPRKVWEVSLADGSIAPAFEWLGPVDSFTFTTAADRIAAGRGDTVVVYDATTAAPLREFSPATRGVVHPKARWVALEHDGAPYQLRAPDRVTPIGDPLTTRVLSFADLESGKRWELSSIQGWKWQWYEITDYYGSFLLWGFDGKPFRRNVMLGDLLERMTGAEIGELVHGVEAMPGATPTDGAGPAAPGPGAGAPAGDPTPAPTPPG